MGQVQGPKQDVGWSPARLKGRHDAWLVCWQGNVDPVVLFASEDAIESAVKDCLQKAGGRGHILNLGHGVLVGTPEESVAHMFHLSKTLQHCQN